MPPRWVLSVSPQALVALAVALMVASGCQAPSSEDRVNADAQITPQYDPKTGRLDQLVAVESKADGGALVRAYMAGAFVDRIELDTNADGQPDRWEYYGSAEQNSSGQAIGGARSVIVRAEQATRRDGKLSRWEYYVGGVIDHVDEDVDGDGRLDKWERYANGALASVDLDLTHEGKATKRFVYRPDGNIESLDLPSQR